MRASSRSALIFCFFILLIFLGTVFFRIGGLPLMGADEPRYARIAEEMYQGGRWITPTLEGIPWLEKPPLYYWLTIPIYALFGFGEFASRLGPALCALLTSLVIYWLGAKLWTRLAGFLGAGILLTSIGFCAFGRSASTDMPMTACLTAALAILAVAAVQDHFPTWKILPAYVLIGLAILAKGPVALLLVIGIALLFWCLDERGGSLRRWRPEAGILIVAAVSLPWFLLAFKQNGYSFILVFFLNHNIARYVSDIHHHSQPFYYFIPVLLGLIFPWTGWLPSLFPESAWRKLRSWRECNRSALFLVCWIAFPFVFFSISQSKLAGYILPVLPPLALALGVRLAGCLQEDAPPRLKRGVAWLHLSLSAAVALAIPWTFQEYYGEAWRHGIPLASVAMAPAIVVFLAVRKKRWGAAVRATIFQGVILVLGITQFGFPLLAGYHSTRDIARQALAARVSQEPVVTYRFFHHSLLYYTGYIIEIQLQDGAELKQYALANPRFLVVTEAAHLVDLQELQGFSAVTLGKQGKYLLLRVEHK